MNHLLKNLAIMGGMLGLFAYGAGPISLDRTLPRAVMRTNQPA